MFLHYHSGSVRISPEDCRPERTATPRKTADGIAQCDTGDTNEYESTIYYNLYPDIYKMGFPLRNNNAIEGTKSGLPLYLALHLFPHTGNDYFVRGLA